MPTDKHELERRIALTTPKHFVRGYSFIAVLELVERHAGERAAAALRAPVGRNVVGSFNYPAADFLRLAFGAADALEPHFGSIDAALVEMGRAAASALMKTEVGETWIALVRGTSPEQLLRHAPTAYGVAVTYGTRTVSSIDATAAKISFKNDLMPAAYHVGIFRAGLAAVGMEANVEGLSVALDTAEVVVRWK